MTRRAGAAADGPHLARLFTIAVLVYFAAQTAVRTLLGGAFEVDEAEMLLLARDLRWGYGLQLPLYNWWQLLWFELFGVNTFAVAGAKNLLRALTLLVLFRALGQVYPVRLAAAGAAALMLVPDFLWQGQRAGTHSTALCLMMAVFLWALVGVVRTGRWRDYLWLGAALGLGVISKYNFLLYALPLLGAAAALRETRPAILSRRMGLALGVAVGIAAGPLLWLVLNADRATTSAQKFFNEAAPPDLPGWLNSLILYGQGMLIGLAPVLILAVLLRGRRVLRAPAPWGGGWLAQVLWWALVGATLVGVAGAVGAGISNLETRWLLPQFLLAAPVLAIWG
ncbi:glycosyltransferase family 39 protein, partial [Rhodovulum sp.]|uniref:glycosyltransferase family 39 protein n=1 Tax=Rhodovulum sp. TaxID=34009 RepID=UPI0017CA6B51